MSIKNAYHDNNVYASNVRDEAIHISQATSGRKGYFCLGCKKEMQAVKSKLPNRVDYFRHDAKAVAHHPKCTYNDETYRHKLAKEILQRIKIIKVPAVYKFPPPNQEGLANLLVESKYIQAHIVRNELIFYEDELGNIHFGRNKKVDAKYLAVRPDVTFFNNQEEPILFIEIVVTHGIKAEKLSKLKRLGIDTVQIIIPKDSPKSIEDNFHVTENIRWVYNNVEAKSEYRYIPISLRDTKGISPIDEIQRKLFQESFSCRAAEIGNLIRTITRCLESKPYRELEEGLRNEVLRVTRNTEANNKRLTELREDCRSRVNSKFKTESEQLENQSRKIGEEETGLERRYNNKARELEDKRRDLDEKIKRIELGGSTEGRNFEERKREVLEEGEGTIRDIESKIGIIEATETEIREDQQRLLRAIEDIKVRRKTIPDKFRQLERETSTEFDRLENSEVQEIERIEREKEEESRIFIDTQNRIRKESEDLRNESINTIKERNSGRNNELSRGINNLFQTRERLRNFQKDYANLERIRAAWESFKSGAYKNWNK